MTYGTTTGQDAAIEQALTSLVWSDPSLATDPAQTLSRLRVDLPDGVRLEIRVQRRDTLYFVVPPVADDGGTVSDSPIDQMDLWNSGDQFVWILPQDAKVSLLRLREQYRQGQAS